MDVPVDESSIGGALRKAARRWPGKAAFVAGEAEFESRARWTFSELLTDAEKNAWALLTRFRPGDHVAVWAPNCAEWVFIEMGAALAGITLVAVNPSLKANELAHVLGQSLSKGIIFLSVYRGRDLAALIDEVRPLLPEFDTPITMDEWKSLVADAAPVSLPDVAAGDIAQIQYTSGTTGFPKGAQLTHRGLVNNARFYATAIGAVPGDVWVNPMPMFHTAGCGLVTLGSLQTGGVHVLPSVFDPELMLELLESERGTVVLSVPTMLFRMLDQPSALTRNLKAWRLATIGGAPVPPELVRRAQDLLSLEVCIGFGQTESSPYITHTTPDDAHPEWWLTVGKPLPRTEVKVIDSETGETLPRGAVGEICARSVCVMQGYHLDAAATAKALDTDGWLHTGDLGSMDDLGYVRIQGRLKDMIIRGGENIYPREIEDVLFTHPNVASAAVVGVPDKNWGEVVVAFVQLRSHSANAPEELQEFCKTRLASFKVPRIWRVVDSFPQTASGKIQKFSLRAQFLDKP
jgi:fatty-acyl-CoA synthase